jgi:hypothetical protein
MTLAVSPVVVVHSDNSIAEILEQVRAAGAPSVQMIVPPGTTALQNILGFAELRLVLGREQIDLLVISGDEKVLTNARRAKFETILAPGVEQPRPIVLPPAPVAPPSPPVVAPTTPAVAPVAPATVPPLPQRSYETRPVLFDDVDQVMKAAAQTVPTVVPTANPTTPPPTTKPASDDQAILDALDDMPVGELTPSGTISPDLAYDDIGVPVVTNPAITAPAVTRQPDIDPDVNPDDLPPLRYVDDQDLTTRHIDDEELPPHILAATASDEMLEDRGRLPLDDWDTDNDLSLAARREAAERASERLSTRSTGRHRSGRRDSAAIEQPRQRGWGAQRVPTFSDDHEVAEPRVRNIPFPLPAVIAFTAVLLLLAFGVIWFFSNRTTVNVWPAATADNRRSFSNEILPFAEPGNTVDGATVQARALTVDADVTVPGQASKVQAPLGVARGQVVLLNRLGQAIDLIEGTEFVGVNPAGQEVRFLIDAPATVPPAVTTTSSEGTSTRFGRLEVGISARSPGSASNIEANTISQIVLPGQAPIPSGGNLTISHDPIGGGTEGEVFVVTENDINAVLGTALNQLFETGRQRLLSEAGNGTPDSSTIFPDSAALSLPENYEISVINPGLGQQVPDQNNPVFSLTVRGRFSALAVPENTTLVRQLEQVVPLFLLQSGGMPNCPQPATRVTGYRWDGQRLRFDAEVNCPTNTPLPDSTLDRIRESIRGRSQADAQVVLTEFQQQGLIGGFELPEAAQLPSFDLLLTITTTTGPSRGVTP